MKVRRIVGSPITLSILLHVVVLCIMAADLQANPYVKNLHKACSKEYQDCLIECGVNSVANNGADIAPEDMLCSSTCASDYDQCELVVLRTIELSRADQVTLDRHPKPFSLSEVEEEIHRQKIEMGGVIMVEEED